MSDYKLSHLQELEAESIHIIREVAAEFENPVMLYSIGKDSSVMVRLAEKAFAPGKVPFPLMHIDSKWKFKEMIEFRDSYAKKFGWNLIVESNMEAFHAGVGPFTHGSKVHTDLMKTQALLHALDKYKFDAAFVTRRRAVRRNVSSRSAISSINGTRRTSARSCVISITPVCIRARASVYFRYRNGRSWISGNISVWRISRSFPCISPRSVRAWRSTVI